MTHSPQTNIIRAVLTAAVLAVGAGCSAGHDYWTNRLDDAKDIVSFTVGWGFGVKAQAGPIQADTGYNYASRWGLRGGESLRWKKHAGDFHVCEGNIGVPLPLCNAEIFFPGKHAADRGKAYCAATLLLPVLVLCPEEHSRTFCNHCAWERRGALYRAEEEKNKKLSPEERKKVKGSWVPLTKEEEKNLDDAMNKENPPDLPFDGRRAWYKYTGVEVTVALFGGFSFGINPGELLDFLAGFFRLDIFRDDL